MSPAHASVLSVAKHPQNSYSIRRALSGLFRSTTLDTVEKVHIPRIVKLVSGFFKGKEPTGNKSINLKLDENPDEDVYGVGSHQLAWKI